MARTPRQPAAGAPAPSPAPRASPRTGTARGGASWGPARDAPAPAAGAARLPSGWPALDARLGGGWPGGVLSELCGRGRTSLALGAVRQAQARGLPVAWIDGGGAFCPVTARVDLAALTLIRPEGVRPDGGVRGDGGEDALTPAQRGRLRRRGLRPGVAADRALLAADLLLRSRAFALVVLDLPDGLPGSGGSPARWFRLARQAEAARAWLLLLGGAPRSRAGSAADLVLLLSLRPVSPLPGEEEWREPPPPRLELRLARWRGAPACSQAGADEALLLGPAREEAGDAR